MCWLFEWHLLDGKKLESNNKMLNLIVYIKLVYIMDQLLTGKIVLIFGAEEVGKVQRNMDGLARYGLCGCVCLLCYYMLFLWVQVCLGGIGCVIV